MFIITYSYRDLEFDLSKERHMTFDIPFDQPLDVYRSHGYIKRT
jgi:hypothetical protein